MALKFVLCSYLTASQKDIGWRNDLVEELDKYCSKLSNVVIHDGSVFDVSPDVVVQFGNSFGFLSYANYRSYYLDYFGEELQSTIREEIQTKHFGELLVGNAISISTNHVKVPHMIVAPVMRIPGMELPADTVAPYLAMKGICRLLMTTGPRYYNDKEDLVIAVPVFGGWKKLKPEIAARQCRLAIDHSMFHKFEVPTNYRKAENDHKFLYVEDVTKLPQFR